MIMMMMMTMMTMMMMMIEKRLSHECIPAKLPRRGRYCGMCYQKQVSTELKVKERKGRCRTSSLGCAICKEPICMECWKEGYDRHA
jgi:hypothetical protein